MAEHETLVPGGHEKLAEEIFGKVKIQIDALKTSVSSGKALVAAAVTDKGVQTAATDSFATMAGNIRQIVSGPSAEGVSF